MILTAYSIRDIHSGFSTPTFEYNDAVAVRQFENAVRGSSGVIASHAKDFSLYRIGTFDTDSGVFEPCTGPRFAVIREAADVL